MAKQLRDCGKLIVGEKMGFTFEEIKIGFIILSHQFLKSLLELRFRKAYQILEFALKVFVKSFLNIPKDNNLKCFGFIWRYPRIEYFSPTITTIFVVEIYKFIKDLINSKEPIIIDAGAYLGDSVFYFKNVFPNSMIYAIEPVYSNYLKENIEKNKIKGVIVIDAALSKSNGEKYIAVDGMSSTLLRKSNNIKKVRTITLKKFKHLKVDLLKLDIEGEEYEVFENADLSNVKNIVAELHCFLNKKKEISKILRRLEKFGFYYIVIPDVYDYRYEDVFTYILVASKNKEKIKKLMKKFKPYKKVSI